MKLRMITGLALVLALGGCASYGYVDDGGGYYTGGSSVDYRYSGYGGYGGYGYGAYGYGSPYGYRYTPGWSLGVGYGSPYGYYPRYPYYSGSGYYRPPHHNPPHPPRPGDHDGHDGHDGPDRPHRPPHAGAGNPPLDRAPWRDLDRVRDGDTTRPQRPQARPNAMRPSMMPRADGETWQRPTPSSPQPQRRMAGPRPDFQGSQGDGGQRYRAPAGQRISSREAGDAAPRQSQPRMERRMEGRSGPRPSAASRGYPTGGQSETGATENP